MGCCELVGGSSFGGEGVGRGGGGVPVEGGFNPKKIWVKGFGRKMMGEVLREEGNRFVRVVNDSLVLGEPKFCPRVFGLNGDMSAGVLFDTVDEAVCFFKASKGVEVPFGDSKGGGGEASCGARYYVQRSPSEPGVLESSGGDCGGAL